MRPEQHTMHWRNLTGGALLALGWLGCGDGSLAAAPPDPFGVEGTIVERGRQIVPNERFDQLTQVWVKMDAEPNDCGRVYTVVAETVIRVRKPDGSVERGGLEDLAVGERVEAWANGIVLLSCPARALAHWILVLR